MNNNKQPNDDFPAGFLIKDKSGQFKKVNEDEVIDYKPTRNQQNKSKSQFISTQSAPTAPAKKKSEDNSATQVNNATFSHFQPASKSSFVAESDDEEEIRKHQEELDKILSESHEEKTSLRDDIILIIDNLIEKFELKFEADVYKKRFIKIVESRIKEIRSAIETAEVLQRVKKIGGLELTEDIARKIVKELDKIISKKIPQKIKIPNEVANTSSVSKKKELKRQSMLASAPPAFVPIPSIVKKTEDKPKQAEQVQKQEDVLEQKKEKLVETQTTQIPKKPQPIKNVEKVREQKKDIKFNNATVNKLYSKTPSEAMAKISKIRQVEPDRPQVIDIRQPAITIGPVEEIGEIDTKEFRRMGENPSSSAEKVLEKIYLLEEDSWEERMKGLQSWQQSPIYKLYIEIGRASIKNNIPVAQTISQRDSDGSANLHLEEFLAINSLNNKLVI